MDPLRLLQDSPVVCVGRLLALEDADARKGRVRIEQVLKGSLDAGDRPVDLGSPFPSDFPIEYRPGGRYLFWGHLEGGRLVCKDYRPDALWVVDADRAHRGALGRREPCYDVLKGMARYLGGARDPQAVQAFLRTLHPVPDLSMIERLEAKEAIPFLLQRAFLMPKGIIRRFGGDEPQGEVFHLEVMRVLTLLTGETHATPEAWSRWWEPLRVELQARQDELPARERVEALVRQLGDDEVLKREEATSVLRMLGPNVFPVLEAYAGKDPEILQSLRALRVEIASRERYRAGLLALDGFEERLARESRRSPIPSDPEERIRFFEEEGPDEALRFFRSPALDRVSTGMRLTGSANALLREEAACWLGRLGDPKASSNLLALLDDPDSQVAATALEALGACGDETAALALLKRRRAGDLAVVARIGAPSSADPLARLLEDPDPGLRAAALRALAALGDPRALPGLLRGTASANRDLRVEAVQGLRRFATPEAISALETAAASEDVFVCQGAADALRKIGGPAACQALLRAAQVRPSAAVHYALGGLGFQQAAIVLREALSKGSDPASRSAAAWALGRLGAPQDVPLFLALLSDKDDDVAGRAAEVLGGRRVQEAAPECLRHLRNPLGYVNARFVEALGLLGCREALEPLAGILTEYDRADVRALAARALGRIGDPAALGVLGRAASEGDESVRIAASWALARLGDTAGTERLRRIAAETSSCWRRVEALSALVDLGDAVGKEALLSLVDAPDPDERGQAIGALARPGDLQAASRLAARLRRERLPHLVDALEQALSTASGPRPDPSADLDSPGKGP